VSRYMLEKVGKDDYVLFKIVDEQDTKNFLSLILLYPNTIRLIRSDQLFVKGETMLRWNWGDGKPNHECIIEEFPDDDSALLYFELGGFDL
jgi:hypothetical protein